MLDTEIGDPRGVPANAATVGFFQDPDWKLEDGMWVRDEDEPNILDMEVEEYGTSSNHGPFCGCEICKDRHGPGCNCPVCN